LTWEKIERFVERNLVSSRPAADDRGMGKHEYRRAPTHGAAATAIQAKRLERGLYQDEVADAAGLSLTTYRKLETGRLANPKVQLLLRCAAALGCTVDDLIEPSWQAMSESRTRRAMPLEIRERQRVQAEAAKRRAPRRAA
jgi:transcriptional regulator with XRE-family HTH domain